MTTTKMRVLVIGGTGTVGSHAVRELLERGATPVLFMRQRRAVPTGAETLIGDALDASAVDVALNGVDRAVFVVPHEAYDVEVRMTDNVLGACARRGVPVTMFTIGLPGKSAFTRWIFGALIGAFMPMYKERIKAARAAFLHPARPRMVGAGAFCQLSSFFLDDILQGHFTEPTGTKGMSRVDAYDIGAVVAAVTLAPLSEERVVTGAEGTEMVTGPMAAALWARELGRPVEYAGDQNDRWQQTLARGMSGPKLEQHVKVIAIMRKAWVPVSQGRVRAAEKLIGRPARGYSDYVRETVRELRARGDERVASRAE